MNFRSLGGLWKGEGTKPQIVCLSKEQERRCGRRKGRNNYSAEFISSFSFCIFPLQRNSKIHIFIQCLHLISTFFQSVVLGLKLLIEQFLQAVCNSCCGNSLCTSAGIAALFPYVTTAAWIWNSVFAHIVCRWMAGWLEMCSLQIFECLSIKFAFAWVFTPVKLKHLSWYCEKKQSLKKGQGGGRRWFRSVTGNI